MMQAGRELNAKVADALGYKIISGEIDNVNPVYNNGHRLKDMDFSGSWSWMGVLVEEARKQRLEIALVSNAKGHWARVFPEGDYPEDPFLADHEDAESMPFAVAMAFLKAKGIEVTA